MRVQTREVILPLTTYTRATGTTQYAAGDLIANHATAANVVGFSFPTGQCAILGGQVVRARLWKDDDDTTTPGLRLHLFTSDPFAAAPENGDNGAIALNAAFTDYIGSIDLDPELIDIFNDAGNPAVGVPEQGSAMMFKSPVLYGALEALEAYTPASAEVFTIQLEVLAF